MEFFCYCPRCEKDQTANPAHYWNYDASTYVLCSSCLKPINFYVKTFRGDRVKLGERITVNELREPPMVIDKKDFTVLLVQRGYRRYSSEDRNAIWSLEKIEGMEERMGVWNETDHVHWDRDKEKQSPASRYIESESDDFGIDREANREFLNQPRQPSPFDG